MINNINKKGGSMKKSFMLAFVFLAVSIYFSAPFAQAISYNRTCSSNHTLRTSISRDVCDEDGCYSITIEEDNICEYGCDSSGEIARCKESPFMRNLVFIIVVGVIILTSYLIIRSKVTSSNSGLPGGFT